MIFLKIFKLGCKFLKINRVYDNKMTATQFYVFYSILNVVFIVLYNYFSERAQLESAINFEQNSKSMAKIFQLFKKNNCAEK